MRSKIFALVLSWLSLAGPLAAQPIDMAPICASYAGRTLFTKNAQPVAMSCEQLTEFSGRFNLKQPVFSAVLPKLLPLGSINLDDLESGVSTGRVKCSRSTLPSGRYALHCTLQVDGAEVRADASADDDGYVTEIAYLMTDFRGLLKPRVQQLNVEPEDVTDDFYQLVLDVAIAKDATFGASDVTMERIGVGIRINMRNIPRTAAPRIRRG